MADEIGNDEDFEQQEPTDYQECTDCLTSSEFASIFLCHACNKHLCTICGSYGLDDHRCVHCTLSFCLECRGDHTDQCMSHLCSDMAGGEPSVHVEVEEIKPAGPGSSTITLTEQQQKRIAGNTEEALRRKRLKTEQVSENKGTEQELSVAKVESQAAHPETEVEGSSPYETRASEENGTGQERSVAEPDELERSCEERPRCYAKHTAKAESPSLASWGSPQSAVGCKVGTSHAATPGSTSS